MTKVLGLSMLVVVGLIAPSTLTQHFGAATASASPPPTAAPCRPVVHVRTVTKTRLVTKVVTRVVYRTRTVVKLVPAPTATPLPAPANAATHNGVVVQASNLHQDPGDSMSAPAAGQQYIVMHIVITNQGTQSADYNAMNFTIADGTDHVRHDVDYFDLHISNTRLGSGSLGAGQIVAGDIAFQVAASETQFTLLWTPDSLGDSVAVPLT